MLTGLNARAGLELTARTWWWPTRTLFEVFTEPTSVEVDPTSEVGVEGCILNA